MLGHTQSDTAALVRRSVRGPLVADALLAVPLTFVWLQLFELRDVRVVALICAGLFALRVIAWLVHARRSLAGPTAELREFPVRHGWVYAASWAAYVLVGTLIFRNTSEAVGVGPGAEASAGVLALGVLLGASALAGLHAEGRIEALLLEQAPATPSRRPRLALRLGSLILGPSLIAAALVGHVQVGELGWLALASMMTAWSLVAAFLVERSIARSVERMRGTLGRLVENGELSSVAIPIVYDDELGALARDLNACLEALREFVAALEVVAGGRLDIEIDGRGELATALRRVVELVHDAVAQIRMMAVEVATTAAQIEVAAHTQASATERQADGMRQIAETMTSLTHSAAQISNAVQEVFSNAESTLATADELAATFAALDQRNQGIGKLLDVIRDIANRSDLLALNGALEASRVGQPGAGFMLIAEEMRSLAERVTRTVVDVRKLVRDIAEDSSSTVDLTELGRTLAEGTTFAAREIAGETQRQTTETGSASQAVLELAEYVTQTGVSATRTRNSAEELLFQAQQLQALTHGFLLRTDARAAEQPSEATGDREPDATP